LLVELIKKEIVRVSMVTYQFEVDADTWAAWKDTVPRSKNLDERLRELVVADTEGRVLEPGAADSATESAAEGHIDTATPTPEAPRSVLEDVLAGDGDLLDRRVDEALAMYDHLREEGAAKKSDLLEVVDVEATGYDSAPSVWANMAKGKLGKLPGVEAPPTGKSTWRYVGEHDDGEERR
jgi:hypothetical protein